MKNEQSTCFMQFRRVEMIVCVCQACNALYASCEPKKIVVFFIVSICAAELFKAVAAWKLNCFVRCCWNWGRFSPMLKGPFLLLLYTCLHCAVYFFYIHFTLTKRPCNCNSIWFELFYWRTTAMITTATLQSYGVRQTCYYSLQTNWNGCMCGCVNVLHTHLVKERNEYGYVCLTHVEGWPVKNNVITNREWNKKRRWSKEKTNNNTSDFFGCQVPDDREWRNRYLDLAREEEQANDQMKKGGRMQEHSNGYQYHGSVPI